MNSEIVGVILAGGLSRRMGGGAKALLPLDGRPMVAHVIDRIRPYVDDCVLNVNGDVAAFAPLGLPLVADVVGDYAGPLAGLLSGMRWAQDNHPDALWVVTAPCDTPFLPANYVDALADEAPDAMTIVIAASAERDHFASGLWPVALADDLAAFLASGERRIQSWIGRNPNAIVTFPLIDDGRGGLDPFFNVNTPEDLAMAERFARERRP